MYTNRIYKSYIYIYTWVFPQTGDLYVKCLVYRQIELTMDDLGLPRFQVSTYRFSYPHFCLFWYSVLSKNWFGPPCSGDNMGYWYWKLAIGLAWNGQLACKNASKVERFQSVQKIGCNTIPFFIMVYHQEWFPLNYSHNLTPFSDTDHDDLCCDTPSNEPPQQAAAACCSIATQLPARQSGGVFLGSTFAAETERQFFWNCLTTHRQFESGQSLELKISQDIW